MLLFALWFQDKHAAYVQFTAGIQSHNMPAEYICFYSACLNSMFFSQKLCVLLL